MGRDARFLGVEVDAGAAVKEVEFDRFFIACHVKES